MIRRKEKDMKWLHISLLMILFLSPAFAGEYEQALETANSFTTATEKRAYRSGLYIGILQEASGEDQAINFKVWKVWRGSILELKQSAWRFYFEKGVAPTFDRGIQEGKNVYRSYPIQTRKQIISKIPIETIL